MTMKQNPKKFRKDIMTITAKEIPSFFETREQRTLFERTARQRCVTKKINFDLLKGRLLFRKVPDRKGLLERYEKDYQYLETRKTAALSTKAFLEEEYNIAKQKVESAEKLLLEAKKTLREAEKSKLQSENELNHINVLIEQSTEEYKSMQMVVLIHPSATFKQISENIEGIFVATSTDAECLSQIGCVDKVFNDEERYKIDTTAEFIKKYPMSLQELNSIINFVSMVITCYINSGTSFKVIYSNDAIDELLRINGFKLIS